MENLLALPGGTELVGDYRIERVLGAGGFGITYLAEEISLQRQVAVKEYFPNDFALRDSASQVRHRSESAKEDYAWGLERFIEEAQSLARFDHANIVRVYRYFRTNNTAYMVLQLEEGRSFRQWLDDLGRAPTQAELDAILKPLLDALDMLHKNDFLHRDIAGDNILIRRDGAPVLIDFGSARGDVANHTRTLSALVKPGYSPLEQYASNGSRQGPWTDIYALAATLYLAVTGVRPLDAPTRVTRDELEPAARAARGDYRAGFLSAIDRALSLQIEARPRSIREWRRELLGGSAQQTALPDRQRHGKQTPTKITRKLETEFSPALVWKKPKSAPPVARDPARVNESAPPASKPAGPGLHKRFAAQMAGVASGIGPKARATAQRFQGSAGAGVDALRNAVAALPPRPKLPSVQIIIAKVGHLLRRQKIKPRKSLIKALEENVVPELTAGSQTDASLPGKPIEAHPAQNEPGRRKSIRAGAFRRSQKARPPKGRIGKTPPVRNVRPNHLRRILRISGMAARLAVVIGFVAMLVYVPNRTEAPKIAAWSLQSAPATTTRLDLVRTLRGHTSPITALAISDTGQRIASTSRDGPVVIWNPQTGARIQQLDLGSVKVNAIDMAGDRLVMAQEDGRVTLWDLDKGNQPRSFRRHKGPVHAAVFAAKPTRFYSAGSDTRLRIWDTRRGTRRSLKGHKGPVTALARSPDGRLVVSGSTDKTVKLWDIKRRKLLKTLHAHTDAVTSVAIAPSGRLIASGSADQSIKIFPLDGNGEIKTLYGHEGAVTAVAFAPSGRLLASSGTDHTVKLWNVETGALIHTFVGHTDVVSALGFMPDGRRLVTAGADRTVRIWSSQIAGYR